MSYSQIRLTKTPDINRVLNFLKDRYQLLSEVDIIKLALAEKYQKARVEVSDEDQEIKQAWEDIKKEGKKIGEKLMREKGLDPKKVTEQEFYDLFLDDHNHSL